MKLLPFKPIVPNSIDPEEFSEFTSAMKNKYLEFKEEGRFSTKNEDCFVIYQVESPLGKFSGIVALNSFDDYDHMIGHEKTLYAKEEDHISNQLKMKTILKPVLIGYEDRGSIAGVIADVSKTEPDKVFTDHNTQEVHRLWFVDNYKKIQEIFNKEVENCFIADGHHRYQTIKQIRDQKLIEDADYKGLLCYYVSFEQLRIFAYNRILPIDKKTFPSFIKQLEKLGSVTELDEFRQPYAKHEIIIIYRKAIYSFAWLDVFTVSDGEIVFDVDLFNHYIVEDLFNIETRSLQSDNFIEGTLTIDEVYKKLNKESIAFLFYPIQSSELIQNCIEGNYLPPKSTWFYPRVKTGIINAKI